MSETLRERELAQLLEEAIQLPTAEQWTFLEQAASDLELAREAEAMLRGQTDLGGFLSNPIFNVAEGAAGDDVFSDSHWELKPSDRLGPFRILEVLGRGGMGVVYRAEQLEPVRREVALKVIKPGMDTRQVVSRFELERQALAMMDHPAIARVYSAGATPEGRPYFAMELVRGIPITKHCDQERLTVRRRLELFLEVCDGVQHAHSKAVIHRDLKPSNVLVSVSEDEESVHRWAPKIIDFGIAKATAEELTGETLLTRMGALIGTPGYMSPEQAGKGEDVDTRSDVYSLGVILYELLVGAQPFVAEDLLRGGADTLIRNIREIETPRPSTKLSGLGEGSNRVAANRGTDLPTLQRQLSGDLEWITLKALAKDRELRYQSPRELAADIKRYLADETVTARPPSTAYRMRKLIRRHRTAVSLVLAALVLLLAFAVTMAVQAGRIAAERDRANEAAERARAAAVRAEQEAEAKGQVSGFLQGLFTVSDPSLARGQTVTARELLDRGAARIEDELADQPRLRAEMMQVIGVVYRELGLYGPAESLLKQAASLRTELLGDNDLDTLAANHELADLYERQGRYREAEELSRRTLNRRERVLGKEHPATLRSLDRLSSVLRSLGRFDEAEQQIRLTLEAKTSLLGADHPDTWVSLADLGRVLEDQGYFAEAEQVLRQAFESRRSQLGEDHPETLTAKNRLAGSIIEQGRGTEGEELLREVVETSIRVWGEDHPGTFSARSNLASSYLEQGKYSEAEQLTRQILEAETRVLGPEHPSTLSTIRALADIITQLGQIAEAEAMERGALEVSRKRLGADHPQTLWAQGNLAQSLRLLGRLEEAEVLQRKTLEACRRALGNDHPDTIRAMSNLGGVLLEMRRLDEALELRRETVEARSRSFGDDHPDTVLMRINLGELLWIEGRFEEGAAIHRKALEDTLQSLADRHHLVVWTHSHLAWNLLALDRFDEAESLAREAVRVAQQELDPEEWPTLAAKGLLSEILARVGRHEEARGVLEENLEIAARLFEPNGKPIADAYYSVAVLELASGDQTAALDYLLQAAEAGYPIPRIHTDTFFEPLHPNPRMQAILAREW